MDKNVIGAHAEGFNNGSVGVAVLGTYNDAAPPAAAQTALAKLLAWRLAIAHVDPLSTVTAISAGNPKYAAGTPVVLHAVSGHRDTGPTSCPGNALYALIGTIAARAVSIGLPKLYSPTADGGPGGVVTIRAHLSAPLPWTVTITDPNGRVISSGTGFSSDVYWTWNASTAAQARYTWRISAGESVTPAIGYVGTAPVPLTLTRATAKPATVSAGKTNVSYKVSTAASVTATLNAADGRVLATLFQQQVKPGPHSFAFSVDSVSDGRYTIVLLASDGKTTVSATVPLIVDRTVSAFSVTPTSFSPNGDGRQDRTVFAFHLSGYAHIRIDVTRAGKLIGLVADGDSGGGDQQQPWDGTINGRRVSDGLYQAVLTATSSLGTTSHALPVRVDTVAPRLRAVSFRRLTFRISEPAHVTLVLNGRTFARDERAGTFVIRPLRRVRRASVSATDAAGNVSRTLRFP
jgi:hypothetical protein